jgi:hypothetical protein
VVFEELVLSQPNILCLRFIRFPETVVHVAVSPQEARVLGVDEIAELWRKSVDGRLELPVAGARRSDGGVVGTTVPAGAIYFIARSEFPELRGQGVHTFAVAVGNALLVDLVKTTTLRCYYLPHK